MKKRFLLAWWPIIFLIALAAIGFVLITSGAESY
jgi:hypothetical protein